MGSGTFALPALIALNNSEHELVAVYTQPSKPCGRGQKTIATDIQQYAIDNKIKLEIPTSLKDQQDHLKNYQADLIVVVSYGLILSSKILLIPTFGCINVHPSQLPRWRGAAPIQRAIIAGDQSTAICIMKMDQGLDTGDILASQTVDIPQNISAGELSKILALKSTDLLLATINSLNRIVPTKQSTNGIIYANKLEQEEANIDWQKEAITIERLIRGLNPWPVTYFNHQNEKIKVFAAQVNMINHSYKPGTIIDKELNIACGAGVIRPLILQRPNRKRLLVKEFLQGYKIIPGTILSQ